MALVAVPRCAIQACPWIGLDERPLWSFEGLRCSSRWDRLAGPFLFCSVDE